MEVYRYCAQNDIREFFAAMIAIGNEAIRVPAHVLICGFTMTAWSYNRMWYLNLTRSEKKLPPFPSIFKVFLSRKTQEPAAADENKQAVPSLVTRGR